MNINKATIKWTISKARDTYGYNVVTLLDVDTGKKYKAMGGGYDMTGTVFADWMEDTQQARLKTLAEQAQCRVFREGGEYKGREYIAAGALYGLTAHYADGVLDRVSMDGACGLSSIENICEAAGLCVEKGYDRSKRNPELIAFYVFPKEKTAEAA